MLLHVHTSNNSLTNEKKCPTILEYHQGHTANEQGQRTNLVTVAGDAHPVLPLVVVVSAPLTVWSGTVGSTVKAVPAVSCTVILLLVEVAAVGVAVAGAGWKE